MLVSFIRFQMPSVKQITTAATKLLQLLTVKTQSPFANDCHFFKLQREVLADRQRKGAKQMSELCSERKKEIRVPLLYSLMSQPTDINERYDLTRD